MSIFYGSNAGTCEALAASLAGTASSHGYNPQVTSLDNAIGKLADDRPVIIITSSYEGEPPDNAAHFFEWLEVENDLKGVRYAVFGCGHREISKFLFTLLLMCLKMTGPIRFIRSQTLWMIL